MSMNINTADIEILKPIVQEVLIHSQAYPFERLELDQMMRYWLAYKKDYIDLFGGVPIVRSEDRIAITLSEAGKERKFNSMIEMLEDEVDVTFKADNGVSFYDFLVSNQEGFFDNKVVHPYPEIKIRKDMKLLKCFKYFLPSFTATRTAQDLASRFIQDSKVEGYLYLSVHPLDFLTLSENNSNWRSCHSLDGDYRAGNLSYMLDDTTIVAYLADDKNEQLRALPEGMHWLDKKWRMLLHTNSFRSVIYYDRQYPFDSDNLLLETANMINNILDQDFKIPAQIGFSTIDMRGSWGEIGLDHNFMLGLEDCIYDTKDVIDTSGFLGYSDLIYSPHYSPIAAIKRQNEYVTSGIEDRRAWHEMFHATYDIKIGAPVPCVHCGRRHIERTDSFLCEECIAEEDADEDYYLVCECCGSRIYNYDEAHRVHDELLCNTCFDAIDKKREGDI